MRRRLFIAMVSSDDGGGLRAKTANPVGDDARFICHFRRYNNPLHPGDRHSGFFFTQRRCGQCPQPGDFVKRFSCGRRDLWN